MKAIRFLLLIFLVALVLLLIQKINYHRTEVLRLSTRQDSIDVALRRAVDMMRPNDSLNVKPDAGTR